MRSASAKCSFATFFMEIRSLNAQVWIVCFAILFVYSATFPIGSFTSDLLQTKFKLSSIRAGELQGAVYLLAGLILPLVGYICDQYGRLPLLMLVAALFNLLANLGWVFTPDTCVVDDSCTSKVIWAVTLMSLSYGIFAGTSWNALCYLVK